MAVWLGDGEMALEYGGRTLSRYEVSLSLGAKLESVTNPRLFASPYETGQPKLFALSALGEGGWIKAMRLKGYAPRSPGRPKALSRPCSATRRRFSADPLPTGSGAGALPSLNPRGWRP